MTWICKFINLVKKSFRKNGDLQILTPQGLVHVIRINIVERKGLEHTGYT